MEMAYVLVQSDIAHEMEVMRDILEIELVREARGTFGKYDILVKVEAESHTGIEGIITGRIRAVPHVLSTTTLPVVPEQEE